MFVNQFNLSSCKREATLSWFQNEGVSSLVTKGAQHGMDNTRILIGHVRKTIVYE